MGSFRRNGLAAGWLVLLSLGCSKAPAPVAQIAPVPEPVIAKVEPTAAKPDLPKVAAEPQPEFGPTPTLLPVLPKPIQPPVLEPKPMEIPKVIEPVIIVQAPKPPEPETPKTDSPKPIEPPLRELKKTTFPTFVDGKPLAEWIKQMNHITQPDPQQREFALKTLPQFGPDARKPSIGPITDMIYKDPDPGVRIVAITIISNMGYDIRDQIKPSVSALRTCIAMTGSGSIVRLYCVRSLMSFGTEAVSAIPELKQAGFDSSWETRFAAAAALGRIGSPPSEKGEPNDAASKFLLNTLLKDSCAGVRLEAIQSLLLIGPPKPKNPLDYIKDIELYVEPVKGRLKVEKDAGVLCWLYLLNIMYDDRALPEHVKKIASYIKNPDSPMVRMHAINACSALGPKAAPVIPQLMDALTYAEPELVVAAMSALAQIGTEARAAVVELEKIQKGSKDPIKPLDAPKDWKPDPTLRLVAEDAIKYITGKKKLGDLEPKKDR